MEASVEKKDQEKSLTTKDLTCLLLITRLSTTFRSANRGVRNSCVPASRLSSRNCMDRASRRVSTLARTSAYAHTFKMRRWDWSRVNRLQKSVLGLKDGSLMSDNWQGAESCAAESPPPPPPPPPANRIIAPRDPRQ